MKLKFVCLAFVAALASCSSTESLSKDGGSPVLIVVGEVQAKCLEGRSACLLLEIKNDGPSVIEFGIESVESPYLHGAVYTYQGLRRDGSRRWDDIALSIDEFVAPRAFVSVAPKASEKVAVYFPGEMPIAFNYSEFRLLVIDRLGHRHVSNHFNASGRVLKGLQNRSQEK